MKAGIITCLVACLIALPSFGQGVPVTLQWFESSWETMEDRTADAFVAGYGGVWTPPPSKADSGQTTGYDLFDRFDLGSPGSPTLYGTEAGLLAVGAEQDKAGIGTFVDLVLNHNGFRNRDTPGFEAAGGYPGFVLSYGGDPDGDFHAEWNDCGSDPLICRIAGLIDIAQEKNHVMIRHPVTPGDPQNIPAGTIHNKPDDTNRRFYSDLSLPANGIGIHPFNTADPTAGDAVAENATGLLLRNTRWLIEVVGIDGFRIDAGKHMPDWFFRNFYDQHVWQRGKADLTGNPTTPFCFLEVFDGNWGVLDDYVCKGTTGNCNGGGGVTGNRDVLDFPLYFALRDMLNAGGFGSWENVIGASVDGIFDGNPNDGDFGVQFVQAHDDSTPPPTSDNLAYAYMLMRTGSPVIYFRAEEFGTPDFPRAGRGDALGGQFGDLLTTLIDIHNEYARSDYVERRDGGNPSFDDVLIFERSNASLVGLSDRQDNGYDQRTVTTNFAEGTRLHELTGNATDATVDPNNDIYDVITVGSGGQATIRVPRKKNPNGVTHDRPYVIYGPINPDGDLTLTNVASTIPADPPTDPNGTRRLTPIDMIQSDSFEVKLETDDPDPLDPSEDDLAMLRMDAGLDVNGNGYVDHTLPGAVDYGYEEFLTESVSLESGGVDVGGGVFRGRYRQVIDATQLSEGRHYLSVIAFRARGGGEPPIFETWRKVILIDRLPPEMALADPLPGETITSSIHQFGVRSVDRTADTVHMFIDQPPGTDVVALAELGQGLAVQADRDEFRLTLTGLSEGHHRLDVVAYEATRPDPSVTTFTGILVEIDGFDGLGDLNGDELVTNHDVFPLIQMVQASGQFDPAGDLDGNGFVDADDVPLLAAKLYGGAGHQMGAALLEGKGDSPLLFVSGTAAPVTSRPFFWLQEDGVSSQFGSVTNPAVNVGVDQSVPLYLWFNDDTTSYGFDGISFDIRLTSDDGGAATVTATLDEPPGQWYGATGGGTRSDSGGDGVNDANAFDMSNTDTVSVSPGRLATVNVAGASAGTVKVHMCIGGFGITDGGESVLVNIGFGDGQTTPDSTVLSGGWFGFCTTVPEAVISVLPGGDVPGDFDLDGDVDQSDFGHLQECLLGPTVPQTDPGCADTLLDSDEFVDQDDVAIFLNCMSGANVPGDPGCAD